MTKKLLFGMMAATMVFATSCENELDLGTNAGETAQVTFSVGTPEIATRAFSDGQTATVLQYAVYDAAGNELTDLRVTDAEIHGSTTVNLQLTTGNTYSVIFWAAAEDAPYTVDFSKQTMTVNYGNAVSNDEKRDAFYKYHTFTVTGAQTETIELKRPFAQLNIGTNDYAASKSAGYTPAYSYVKVPVYNTLDLVEGKVSTVNGTSTSEDAVATEFKLATIPEGETFPVSGYEYLSMNYLLVAADKEVVDVVFGYSENNTTVEKTRTVGSVPVQRNYRTNIYGQLLTSDVDVNVVIEPDYDEPDLEVDELHLAAAVGGEVTLTEDVTLTEPLVATASMVINLNGKKITGDGISNNAVVLADGATVTIKGEGEITTTGAYPLGVKNGGTLVVEGGKYTATNSTQAVYVWAGTAYIKGGYYEVDSQYNGTSYVDTNGNGRYVLNCIDASYDNGTAKIVVSGGTFHKFDPANNVAEGANTNFVADGYKTLQDGDNYVVVADNIDAVVNDENSLNDALTASKNVVLMSDINAQSPISVNGNTLDGNGHTLSVPYNATSGWGQYALIMNNGGTVKNLAIEDAFRGIGCTPLKGDIALDNVTTDNVTYAINGDGDKTNVVSVTNSTINGWISFASIKLLSFENCTLGKGQSYDAYLVVYGATTFKDCTFKDGFAMCGDLRGTLDTDVTFINCTHSGTKVTADNFKTLFMAEGDETDFNKLSNYNVIVDGVKVTWN